MFSVRVAPFYINNYFAQRTSCWSCTWTEWTQDNIIQGYIESGRAEAWAQVYKALCFGENFLDLHRNAVLRKLFDKLRSLYLFSPSHPKFSSNYIKHLFWFGFFFNFKLAVINTESTEQGQRLLWYNGLLGILHQSQRLPRMMYGKWGVMIDKKGSFYCGSWSEG